MNFKISELYIENFKSIEKAQLDLTDKKITVLDGPNGFGKTSIFDAIELAITGAIRRIIDVKIADGKKGYDDYLFAYNQELPIIVKVKLYDENSRKFIVLGRKIDHSNLSKNKKRPSDFPSTLHLLSEMNEELTTENIKETITELDSNILNTYNLYNYVEQEECTHLFKRTENERMTAISKLFNIEKEENERNRLLKARNIMLKQKSSLQKKIDSLKQSLDMDVARNEKEKVDYFQLLPPEITEKEIWDSYKILPLDLTLKTTYLKRMDTFKYFVEYFSFFKAAYSNELINTLMNNKKRIEDLLLLYHFQDRMKGLEKENNTRVKLHKILSYIEERDILNPNISWQTIYDNFELPINLENLKDKLTIIRNLNQNSNQLSGIITSLLNTKDQLTVQFEKLMDKQGYKDKTCPMCGMEWLDYTELMRQITSQTKLFKEKQDQTSNDSVNLINDLYKNVMNQLIDDIKIFTRSLISNEVYEKLSEHSVRKVNIKKAKDFFGIFNINIEKHVYDDKQYLDLDFKDLPLRVEQVQEKLRDSLLDTGDFDYEKYEELKDIYNNTFGNNDDLIMKINLEKFNLKKDYINYLYFLETSLQYRKYINLVKKNRIIEAAFNSISRALSAYNTNIESYRAKMIKEIEIPFYIYSGKIIQNYQRGIGIFIREDSAINNDSQIKAIRFVPPQKTDHDIMHTFSSGQLSATVLAFTLALNKVYNNSGLNTILIDDPIQTMDEMNMVSFVELLRNDFEEYQIILSTHENHISLYVRYKFSKYGYQTKQINVKEKLYN